jgi:hypothetical protein
LRLRWRIRTREARERDEREGEAQRPFVQAAACGPCSA